VAASQQRAFRPPRLRDRAAAHVPQSIEAERQVRGVEGVAHALAEMARGRQNRDVFWGIAHNTFQLGTGETGDGLNDSATWRAARCAHQIHSE